MSLRVLAVTVFLLGVPAAAYVVPATPAATPRHAIQAPLAPELEFEVEEQSTGLFSAVAASFGVGAILGWLNANRGKVAGAAAASAVALASTSASAMVEYSDVKYLGGTDKVDINNANLQAYRQFPGMYPGAAGQIVTHGPYEKVGDIYNIPGLDERYAAMIKKYEGNLVALPANPAYFIDRVNNGMYR